MTTRPLAVGLRALLVVGATMAATSGQSGFQRVLPPDTLVFIGVDDVRAYGASWLASPAGQMWRDPACAELRQVISEQIGVLGDEAEMALGVDVLKLPSLVQGPVAIALLDLAVEPGAEDTPTIAVCALADVGEHGDECRSLLDALAGRVLASQTGIVRSTTKVEQTDVTCFADARVDALSGSRLRYAVTGSVAVVLVEVGGLKSDRLPAILSGLKSPPKRSLAAEPTFAASLAGGPRESVRVWADVGRIVARVHPPIPLPPKVLALADVPTGAAGAAGVAEVLTPEQAEQAAAAAEAAEDERQLVALGLRDLGVLAMGGHCSAQGSYAAAHLEWRGDGWIPSILRNFFQPGTFSRLRYAPASAVGVNALRIDLAGLFDEVVKAFMESGDCTPAEVVRGLHDAEEFLGFNPRDDLLELFDGEFVLVSGQVGQSEALPALAEALNVAVIAGLRDPEQFSSFLEELVHRRGLHATQRTEEYEGVTIHRQTIFMVPVPICYAVVDDMLVISGAPSMVQQIIHQKHTPDAPALVQKPAYRDAVAALHPGYGMLGYSDAAADMKSLLRFLDRAPEMFGKAKLGDSQLSQSGILEWLDQLPLPDESVVDKYFHGGTATALTVDESGITLESAGP
jgi:hypothetical protein